MTEAEADAIAKLVWGKRGFARTKRVWTGTEAPDVDGWTRPAGHIYGYDVGYSRTGKRGGSLSTVKGQGNLSFEDAFHDAVKNTIGTAVHAKLLQHFSSAE